MSFGWFEIIVVGVCIPLAVVVIKIAHNAHQTRVEREKYLVDKQAKMETRVAVLESKYDAIRKDLSRLRSVSDDNFHSLDKKIDKVQQNIIEVIRENGRNTK